ncbi:MAG TPA: hypothetical protein VGX68_02080 [Thermoanaerobaculia bacterium]|nr:hypothetical protein [Thermoanaerobaculia bacterium]
MTRRLTYLKGIGNLLGKDWLKALGPVAGFVEAILGFGSGSGSHAPLLINATVKLNGSMTAETLFATILLRAPGSIHADPVNDASSNVLPLYDRPLGIFNLLSAPVLSVTHQNASYPCYVPFSNPLQTAVEMCRKSTDQRLANVDYVINPDSGLELAALDAAYLRAAALPDFYVQGSSDGYRPLCDLEQMVVRTNYSGCPPSLGYCPENYIPPTAEVRSIGLRVRLRATAAPAVEPTLIIRKYKPAVTSSAPASSCTLQCNGTAGQWSGCRGTGCHVCAEKVASYPLYFLNHPSCARNDTCDGLYFTCNANCPAPTSADLCNGTSGQWSGCRGSGCHVCAEKVASYPLYFKNHPACIPNNTCNGSYFTCNANCPAPGSADQCNGTAGEWAGCRGTGCHVCAELVAEYPCYFQNHPYCISNGTCGGLHYTCNSNCPAPTEADRCN